MCAINDPLGQIHSPANSYHYSHLKFCFDWRDFEKSGRTDGRASRHYDVVYESVRIAITAGRDCGSALWINKTKSWLGNFWRTRGGGKNCSIISTYLDHFLLSLASKCHSKFQSIFSPFHG